MAAKQAGLGGTIHLSEGARLAAPRPKRLQRKDLREKRTQGEKNAYKTAFA